MSGQADPKVPWAPFRVVTNYGVSKFTTDVYRLIAKRLTGVDRVVTGGEPPMQYIDAADIASRAIRRMMDSGPTVLSGQETEDW